MGSRVKDIDAKFFTPPDYQLESMNRAVHLNTICSLGTGAGKTFIAVLLIKEYSYQILQYYQKAIFLVDKVALVEQQALHIKCYNKTFYVFSSCVKSVISAWSIGFNNALVPCLKSPTTQTKTRST